MSPLLTDGLVLLAEMAALFVTVSFAVEAARQWLGPHRIRQWLDGPPVSAALKGIGLGFVVPFCTYSALPVWQGLRQAGVGSAGLAAFIVAAPILDPILLGALGIIVGPAAAVAYAGLALVAAFGLAMLAHRFDLVHHLARLPSPVRAMPSGGGGEGAAEAGLAFTRPTTRNILRSSARESVSVLRTMAVPMVIGVVLGLAITLLLPLTSPPPGPVRTTRSRSRSLPCSALPCTWARRCSSPSGSGSPAQGWGQDRSSPSPSPAPVEMSPSS